MYSKVYRFMENRLTNFIQKNEKLRALSAVKKNSYLYNFCSMITDSDSGENTFYSIKVNDNIRLIIPDFTLTEASVLEQVHKMPSSSIPLGVGLAPRKEYVEDLLEVEPSSTIIFLNLKYILDVYSGIDDINTVHNAILDATDAFKSILTECGVTAGPEYMVNVVNDYFAFIFGMLLVKSLAPYISLDNEFNIALCKNSGIEFTDIDSVEFSFSKIIDIAKELYDDKDDYNIDSTAMLKAILKLAYSIDTDSIAAKKYHRIYRIN